MTQSARPERETNLLRAEHAAVEWSPDSGWLRVTLHGCWVDEPLDWIRSHISVSTDVVVDLRDRSGSHQPLDCSWARGSYYIG